MNITAALESSSSKAINFFAKNEEFLRQYGKKIVHVIVKDKKTGDDKESDNSFKFTFDKKSNLQADDLASLFKLENTKGFSIENFREKFAEAVSGDGQEINRITRLGSSSLLAFLCFHGVSDENKLEISWGGDTFVFNEVHFECQNHITTEPVSKCSNIDVFLKGENKSTSRPIALFLESKFSEYFNRTSVYKDISKIYEDDYKEFFANEWELLRKEEGRDKSGNTTIEIHAKNDTQYCSGIKQMISHYRGLKTIVEHGKSSLAGPSENRIEVFKFDGKTDVFLGSIVFDLTGKVRDRKNAFTAYKKLYQEFIKNFPTSAKFKCVPNLFSYQNVFTRQNNSFHFALADSVRTMYDLR